MEGTEGKLEQTKIHWEALRLQIGGNFTEEPLLGIFESLANMNKVGLGERVGIRCMEDY
jgi:hypothetical protein